MQASVTTLTRKGPYSRLMRNIRLLRSYLQDRPADVMEDNLTKSEYEKLDRLLSVVGRKPNVCLQGSFDAGKSTLANILFKKDHLPAALQPTTAIPTFIKHISDRPEWLKDEVYILSDSLTFNSKLLDNEGYFYSYVIKSGSIETLQSYATHQNNSEESVSYNALVFSDSHVLEACNIVDYPGYDNDEIESIVQLKNLKRLLINPYLSNIAGFLNKLDVPRLGAVIRKLPDFEVAGRHFPTLGNLYLIASHADVEERGKRGDI